MELESVKKQSANTLARLIQIESRFSYLEGGQNKPDSHKRYDNVDDYYYGPDY